MNGTKKKRGFSMAEVVIALAVVVMVTFAALTLVLSSITVTRNAVNKSEAQDFASNVLECFLVTENLTDFINQVALAEDKSLGGGEAAEGGATAFVYRNDQYKYIAYITVNFGAPRPSFEIDVTDKDGDSFLAFSYTKTKGVAP